MDTAVCCEGPVLASLFRAMKAGDEAQVESLKRTLAEHAGKGPAP